MRCLLRLRRAACGRRVPRAPTTRVCAAARHCGTGAPQAPGPSTPVVAAVGSAPKTPRTDPQRTAAGPRLNAFSSQMRQLLAQHPPSAHGVGDGEATTVDTGQRAILAALMAHAPLESSAAALHPLLCVRILERLGFPLLPSAASPGTLPGGWMEGRGLAGTREDVLRVFGHVLTPLQPLLGPPDGGAMHPQVRPVLPVALAWWVVCPPLPLGQGGLCWPPLPSELWLPHVLSFYACTPAMPLAREHASPAGEAAPTRALPLPFLLPFLVAKVLRGEVDEAHLPTVLERCLSSTEAWAGARPSSVSGPRDRDGAPRTISDPAMVEALFWASPTPLVTHRVVRQALAQAASAFSPGAGLTLRVGIDSDDSLRRFFLRMTAVRERQGRGGGRGEGEAAAREEGGPRAVRRLFIEPYVAEGCGAAGADPDNVLRWVNPLHDYIALTFAEADPGPDPALDGDAELSFAGVLNLLTAQLDRLQTLRRASPCHQTSPDPQEWPPHTPEAPFTLLPHKPRLHTLKRTCEILLHHTRHILHDPASAPSPTPGDGTAPHSSPATPWFHDVAVPQQEAVLRRLCGAARALVRVAMEERRVSLATEGPEGAVLTAGGAGGRGGSGSAVDPQTLHSEGGGPAVAPRSIPLPKPEQASSSLAVMSTVLRNTAFRVLEPALGRLYEAGLGSTVPQWGPVSDGPPSLSVLLRVPGALDLVSDPNGVEESGRKGRRGEGGALEGAEDPLGPFRDALRDVHQAVGGSAAWATAQQLLQHPGQQPPAAVLEGVRLLAMEVLLFSPLALDRGQGPRALPRERPWAPVLARLEVAVQSLWDWCGHDHDRRREGAATAPDALADTGAGQPGGRSPLQVRLALLALLTVVRAATAAEAVPPYGEGPPSCRTSPALPLAARTAPALRVCCALLQSLAPPSLAGGAGGGGVDAAWEAVGLPPSAAMVQEVSDEATEASTIGPVRVGSHGGGGDTALTLPARWELVEELRGMAAAAGCAGEATWRWVGSPAALEAEVRRCWECVPWGGDRSHGEAAAAAAAGPTLLLIPWSTLAEGRQPLRLYDESGQSDRAAGRLDAQLERLLHGTRPSGWESPARGPAPPRVVIRFVSALEELQYYAAVACREPVVRLAGDVVIVHRELAAAQQLAADHHRRRTARPDEDLDDGYDGLD